MLLLDLDNSVARRRARYLRRALAVSLRELSGVGSGVTLSIGAALGTFADVEGLVERADEALYQAKSAGGDQLREAD